jgi:hypothetical protein
MFLRKINLLPVLFLSTLITSASAYENELTNLIDETLSKTKKVKEQPESTFATYFSNPIGNSFRYLGDWARSSKQDSITSTTKAELKDQVKHYITGDNLQGKIMGKVIEDEKAVNILWRGFGNGCRTFGSLFVGETPTVPRTIKNFFLEKKIEKPSVFFPIISCALLQSSALQSFDQIRDYYFLTVEAINNSSRLSHELDQHKIKEYFLQGYIRYLVANNVKERLPIFVEETVKLDEEQTEINIKRIFKFLTSLDINPFTDLSVTAKITLETVFPQEDELKKFTLENAEKKVIQQKEQALKSLICDLFSIELSKANNQKLRLQINNKMKKENLIEEKKPVEGGDLIKESQVIEEKKPVEGGDLIEKNQVNIEEDKSSLIDQKKNLTENTDKQDL